MSSMPKDHIHLPPKPEPARPAEHPFLVPAPSPSASTKMCFGTRERSIAEPTSRWRLPGCRQAAEAVQRGARALHQDEMRTDAARHKEALEYAYKVATAGA